MSEKKAENIPGGSTGQITSMYNLALTKTAANKTMVAMNSSTVFDINKSQ